MHHIHLGIFRHLCNIFSLICELTGDYDLKVMRQEYYIGQQKMVTHEHGILLLGIKKKEKKRFC